MKDNLTLVKRQLNDSQPGKAQSFLKKLFVSDDPAAQDSLKQLAYLEQASRKPVVTELFKKFAGQSFDSWASRPGREILEAAGGVTSAALGHPAGLVGAAGLLAAQSPKILGALEGPIPKFVAKYSPMAALQAARSGFTPSQINPNNASELQSAKDRIKYKDSKYSNGK